jgi:hypothetical protein
MNVLGMRTAPLEIPVPDVSRHNNQECESIHGKFEATERRTSYRRREGFLRVATVACSCSQNCIESYVLLARSAILGEFHKNGATCSLRQPQSSIR